MSALTRILALTLLAVLTFQAVNAQSPSNGKYFIALANPSMPPIPVGSDHNGFTDSVTVGSKDIVWTVTRSNQEDYVIALEQSGSRWTAAAEGGNLFVSQMSTSATWKLRQQGENSYTIEVPSNIWPAQGWALYSTQSGSKVSIGFFDLPNPSTLWKFTPVQED